MNYRDAVATLADLFPATGTRFRRCYRKQAYPSIETVLAAKATRERQSGLTLGIYHCDYEDHWHLSSHEPTPDQRARLFAQAQECSEETRLDVERLARQIRTLTRQADALMQTMRRRAKQIDAARSVVTIGQSYRQQREDLRAVGELWNEKLDLCLHHDSVVLCVRDVALSKELPTLASYQQFVQKLIALESETEHIREDNTAFITESLASLDVQEMEGIRWLREQMNVHFQMPVMSWR